MKAHFRFLNALLLSVVLANSASNAASPLSESVPSDRGNAYLENAYYCAVLGVKSGNRAVVDLSTLAENIIVSFHRQKNGNAKILLHRRAWKGIFQAASGPTPIAAITSQKRFDGKEITAQDDAIVAHFENNALLEAKRVDAAVIDLHFTGFKVSLGRYLSVDEKGREIEVDVNLRIIIDWNSGVLGAADFTKRSYRRAAYVISQVQVNSEPQLAKEHYYRFLPSRRPFRTLGCMQLANMKFSAI